MKKLVDALTNQNENYILPFLWIHGEDEENIRKELKRIYNSGIRAVCVEARPHKDFNGPKWFEDLNTILEECKCLGMKMWLLDDSHFPTGYANGETKRKYPELCKKFLCCKTMDFVGPIRGSGAILKSTLRSADDEILSVSLSRRAGFEQIDSDSMIDIISNIKIVNDYNTGRPNVDIWGNAVSGIQQPTPVVYFDLPEGEWSLNIVTVSYEGGEKETEGYLNPIVPEATDILLNTVYQPVYDRFKEDFGKTFMGFFSDEPRFGNIHGSENSSIGRNSAMNLPWSDDMLALLLEHCHKLGGILAGLGEDELRLLLPLLFIGDDGKAHALRYAYMDLVSRLYSDNFDGRIADWCHEHNCQHIGHCIEDNNAAARLGYGAGHIFRAMANADMAGIDVVIHQLTPGFDKGLFKGMHNPGWDGEFFTYMLGKLGGSLAHLDAKKKGQCMCELFGAYGWAEGNRLAKWMVDYMLVRGVNVLVPHAFDVAPFPDNDCPPHFCAHGHNPQYPEFRLLMDYSNRMCSILTGGIARPNVALFFNAEGEWSGDYMLTQKPAAVLARNLIDFDLISADFLAQAKAENGKLAINDMSFNALVFPWAEALPGQLLKDVLRLADGGVSIYFVNDLPTRSVEGGDTNGLSRHDNIGIAPLNELAQMLRESNVAELTASSEQPYLRYYHYRQQDGDLYFFVNEHPAQRVQTTITGVKAEDTYVYDAFTNTITIEPDAFKLDLPPYGTKLVVIPDRPIQNALPVSVSFNVVETLSLTECKLSLAPMSEVAEDEEPVFEEIQTMAVPEYVSSLPGYETFSGRIRYRFKVMLNGIQVARSARVVLDGVREGACVRVNNVECGTMITPEYIFPVTGLKEGENTIEVELNTTLGRAMNDFLSQYLPMEPTGMCGAKLEFSK